MEQSIVIGLITFLLGLFLGHRLSLGRDLRKEFNEISHPFRVALLRQREYPTPDACIFSEIEADLFESALPFWQRRGFRKTLDAYRNENKKNIVQDQKYGTLSFANTDEIIKHIDYVLNYTARK